MIVSTPITSAQGKPDLKDTLAIPLANILGTTYNDTASAPPTIAVEWKSLGMTKTDLYYSLWFVNCTKDTSFVKSGYREMKYSGRLYIQNGMEESLTTKLNQKSTEWLFIEVTTDYQYGESSEDRFLVLHNRKPEDIYAVSAVLLPSE